MGRWRATVTFPDGTRKYGNYFTSSDCVSSLHPERDAEGWPAGEPEQRVPDAVPPDDDDLVPVVVTLDRDDKRWHALYCPNRRQLVVGELSSGALSVNLEHWRAPGADGRTHLCTFDELWNDVSLCGVPVGERIDGHPYTLDDPFSHWFDPTWCRDCLQSADREGNGPR